jgi:hypothetical protein
MLLKRVLSLCCTTLPGTSRQGSSEPTLANLSNANTDMDYTDFYAERSSEGMHLSQEQ